MLYYANKNMYTGVRVSEALFNHTSYATYPTIRDALRTTALEMTIQPRSLDDGILLYNAQSDSGVGDFIALILKDGYPEFRYDTGSGILHVIFCAPV